MNVEWGSVKKFVVDESVARDVPLDEEVRQILDHQFANDHRDEARDRHASRRNVEDIDEVDEIDEHSQLVPRNQHLGEPVPVVLEENRQLTYLIRVNGTAHKTLQKWLFAHVEFRYFDSFQVVLKTLHHVVFDILQILIVLLLQVLGNGLGENRSIFGPAN